MFEIALWSFPHSFLCIHYFIVVWHEVVSLAAHCMLDCSLCWFLGVVGLSLSPCKPLFDASMQMLPLANVQLTVIHRTKSEELHR